MVARVLAMAARPKSRRVKSAIRVFPLLGRVCNPPLLILRRTRVGLVREQQPVAAPLLPDLHLPDAYADGLALTVHRVSGEVVTHDGVVTDDGHTSVREVYRLCNQVAGKD